ncbi:hypothetical protein HQ563_16975 [bacterium]|nr:hypothetical protein [bacterium]
MNELAERDGLRAVGKMNLAALGWSWFSYHPLHLWCAPLKNRRFKMIYDRVMKKMSNTFDLRLRMLWNGDVETFHTLCEDEFYDIENFADPAIGGVF